VPEIEQPYFDRNSLQWSTIAQTDPPWTWSGLWSIDFESPAPPQDRILDQRYQKVSDTGDIHGSGKYRLVAFHARETFWCLSLRNLTSRRRTAISRTTQR